jgi:type I restriction enzyme S subunit
LNLNKYSVSTAQPVISQGKLYPIEVSIPPLEEQQLIEDELESKLTVCDKIEETISQSLQQAETLRQSILKKAFEGKLIYK